MTSKEELLAAGYTPDPSSLDPPEAGQKRDYDIHYYARLRNGKWLVWAYLELTLSVLEGLKAGGCGREGRLVDAEKAARAALLQRLQGQGALLASYIKRLET